MLRLRSSFESVGSYLIVMRSRAAGRTDESTDDGCGSSLPGCRAML